MSLQFLGPKQLERMGFRGLEQPEERTEVLLWKARRSRDRRAPGGRDVARKVLATEKPGEHLGKREKTGVIGAMDPEGSGTRIWKHSERYIVVSGCFQLLLTENPAKSGLNSAGLDWLMFGKSWHPMADFRQGQIQSSKATATTLHQHPSILLLKKTSS